MSTVLAIDQGTTKTKSFTLHKENGFVPVLSLEHRQFYPQSGWVEHDPAELLNNVSRCLESVAGVSAVGLANQGETVVAWNAEDGRPIYNALVWQDRRTLDVIERLKADGAEEITLSRAGLPLDPYFSASKIGWIIENVPDAKILLKRNMLRIGTSESFFLDRLAGVYVTDATTASRTSLMNIHTLEWDPDLCRLFGIPPEVLPEIRSTTGDFGAVRAGEGTVPITASVVDQQAALYGHRCFEPGKAKITFGTGAFALANAGASVRQNPDAGILATVAWKLSENSPVYAVDGAVYNAASAVNWLKQIGLISQLEYLDHLEGESAVIKDVIFVPALSGLGGPHWDRTAAGLWIGMGLDTTQSDLVKSVLEGIAFRAGELLKAIWSLVGEGDAVSIDGGLTKNPYFCSFLADAINKTIRIPETAEVTALGTAYLAMIGAGICSNETDLPQPSRRETVINPTRDIGEYIGKFREAISRAKNWRTF